MNDLRTAAQQALDDLKDLHKNHNITCAGTIAALESALAQQTEPVAWMYTGIKQDGTEHGPHLVWKPEYMDAMSASKGAKATPLYFAPPRQAEPVEPVEPVAWRYWKQKWNCWEYSDTKLEFPAVPAGTKMEPLYLVSREVKSEQRPVGTTHKSVKGGVVWNRWPDEMEDGTHLYVNPPPCQTCEALARTVMMDQVGKA